MKTLKIFTALIVITGITFLSAYYIYADSNSKKSGYEAVYEFLKSKNAKNITYDLTDWSIISKDYKDIQMLKSLFKEIEKDLFTKITDLKEEERDKTSYLIAEGHKNDSTYVKVVLQSFQIPPGFEEKGQTFIAVNVIGNNFNDFESNKNILKKIIDKYGGKSRITTCFYGQIYSKLDNKGQNSVIEELKKKLKLDYCDISNEDQVFTLRGYSGLFEENILIMDKIYNVEVEITEEEEKNAAIIWVGIPVLTAEF